MSTEAHDIIREIEDNPLMKAQFELEAEMIDSGRTRYWNSVAKLTGNGVNEVSGERSAHRMSETVPGSRLLSHSIQPVAAWISAWIARAKLMPRKPNALPLLECLSPDQAAMIALRIMLDTVAAGRPMTTISQSLGEALLREHAVSRLSKTHPGLYRYMSDFTKRSGSTEAHARKVLIATVVRVQPDFFDLTHLYGQAVRTRDTCVKVGLVLIEAVLSSTLLFQIDTRMSRGHKKTDYIIPTTETVKWIQNSHENAQDFSPGYMPMVVPPVPWTIRGRGGYMYGLRGRHKIIKAVRGKDVENMDYSQTVYHSLNSIQNTAWSVNRRILDIISSLAVSGTGVAGLPATVYEPFPRVIPVCDIPRKDRTPEQHAEVCAWMTAKAAVHKTNAARLSDGILVGRTLAIADRYKDFNRIYFPHNMDFRGRVYPIPLFLNPQGASWQKALLQFAEGKEVTTENGGLYWLAIHGANCMSDCPVTQLKISKSPFYTRTDWVTANTQRILEAADDPLASEWWMEADSPFEFLAFCFEWAKLVRGETTVSHLPVAMDGSCNGLQHFAALTRDEVGGASVNLIPQHTPSDIYSDVLHSVIKSLHAEALTKPDPDYASFWLNSGLLDRTMCKRPVMTMPYGSKKFGISNQIAEEVKKRDFIWPQGINAPASYAHLSKHIWDALGSTAVKARECMDWLQKIATDAAKHGLPLGWVTPSGFQVVQRYYNTKERQIETKLFGKRYRPLLSEATDELSRNEQANGIAPNFIHSLDASALSIAVQEASNIGIIAFAMIHDSYGTHAADADKLYHIIRASFVGMYRDNDPLGDFVTSIKASAEANNIVLDLEEIPTSGALDLNGVLESQFFFS